MRSLGLVKKIIFFTDHDPLDAEKAQEEGEPPIVPSRGVLELSDLLEE